MELDPEIRAFAEESDRLFGPDYGLLPVVEQRRLYNAWCQHFSAPAPADVVSTELYLPGSDGAVRVRLFKPREVSQPLPVILFCHGGGWILGSPETHAMATSEMVRRTGAAVLSVDYRLAPEHPFPAAFNDAYDVLLWAAQSGAAFGLDPSRIAVCGDSAGGNLSAAVALAARDRAKESGTRESSGGPKIALQALIYPALKAARRQPVVEDQGGGSEASTSSYVKSYAGGSDKVAAFARNPYAMPLAAADFRNLPPAYIAAAGIDAVLEDAHDYAAALKAAGVPVTISVAESLPHSYLRTIHFSRTAAAAFDAICAALRDALNSTGNTTSSSAMTSTTLMAG
jgi:acetyl esterase